MPPGSSGSVWIDGELLRPDRARLPVADHGLLVGDGAFETLKVIDGTPFALTRHLRRLRRSLEILELELPWSDGDMRLGAKAVCAAPDVGVLRITVTSGAGPLGSGRGDQAPTTVMAGGPARQWEPTTAVITVPWRRNEHSAVAGAKTTSYAENVRALATATAAGATEALLANTAGALCEGTGTNVFLVRGGELVTPSLSTGCLAGITRELLLEARHGVEADDLSFDDLRRASEAFLTSSTRDVHPIAAVDGDPLDAAPGPATRAAGAALADIQAANLDP